MASSSGTGDIIKYGLLAVGGYLLWNWWTSQPATTTPAVSTSVSPTATPVQAVSSTVPPVPLVPVQAATPASAPVTSGSLSAALISAAGSSSQLNADGWSYYLTQLSGVALTPQQFSNAFPSLTATNRGPTMTAQQFVQALAAAGLSAPAGYGLNGLGQLAPRRVIVAPMIRRRSW
jgi:hypothetical protein